MTTDRTEMRELERQYNENTPDSLKVPFGELDGQRIPMSKGGQERLELLMKEIGEEFERADMYSKGSLVFIAVMVVSIFLPIAGSIVLWVGGFVGWMYLSHKQNQIMRGIAQRHAFIDGMFFFMTVIAKGIKKMEEEERQKPENKTESDSATIT